MSSSDWEPLFGPTDERGSFLPMVKEGSPSQVAEFQPLGEETKCVAGGVKVLRADKDEEAERVIREAIKRAEHIEREAFEKGFVQGERAGREVAAKAMESATRALERAAERLNAALEEQQKLLERETVRLAVAVAKKILNREFEVDKTAIVDMVRGALKRVQLGDRVTIRVNPMDKETMLNASPQILRELEEVRSIKVVGDDTVERGGALVEGVMGELDLRLEKQFRQVERAFERVMDGGPQIGMAMGSAGG